MKEYRYILASNKVSKLDCPYCGAKKHWQRYINIETGEVLPEKYGRCDNAVKCGKRNDPYKDGYAQRIKENEQNSGSWNQPNKAVKPILRPKPVYFSKNVFSQTLQKYENNVFIQNLLNRIKFPFEVKDIEKIISLYYLGTVAKGYRAGAITFPFIDIKNNVRAIQVKQFNESNHTTATDFLHSIIEKYYKRNNKPLPEWLETYIKQDKKISCLFGEHLLTMYPHNPVALVEAPKTAIYGALYFGFPEQPENLIWLAVYNKSSFSFDKLKVLQGRDVFTFPDLSKDGSTFSEWQTKARDYEKQLSGTRFIFSDLLERLAPETDKQDGNDLADFLIKQDWRQFREHTIMQPEQMVEETSYSHIEPLSKVSPSDELPKKENWDNDISALETYFSTTKPSIRQVKLNSYTTITNTHLFIESHLLVVKAHNGNRIFLPYLNRLKALKEMITVNKEVNIC